MSSVRSSSIIKKLVTITLSFGVIVSGFFLFAPEHADASPSTELVDSGIDYADGRETVTVGGKVRDALYLNPYRGIHVWGQPGVLKLTNDDNNTAVDPSSPSSNVRSLIYFPVDISDFSGAYHPTAEGARGEDAELTTSALKALDETLKNIKKNNNQVILRFVYDRNNDGIKDDEGCIIPDSEVVVPKNWENYNRVVEPRQEMIMRHIEQLAPILIENSDVINTVQIGFYGSNGECNSSGACSNEYIAEALDKMLEETKGSNLRTSVRTPRHYTYYRGIELSNIESDVTTGNEEAYRAAIFNDGYLGTDYDWGTFENREKETDWMATQNLHNPYGGDAIPAPGGETVGDPAMPPAVLNEMFKVHTSYMSPDGLLQAYWKKTAYDGSLYDEDDYAINDSEYEGQSLWTYIENHLGYRFVLRDSKLSESVKSGGTLENTFEIENVGFGNLFYPMQSYAYITDEYGKVVVGPTEVDVDPTSFEVNKMTSGSMDIKIPDDMEPGKYNLYLQFKIGDREVGGETKPYGAIRLANSNIWNERLEANYMGSFKVSREVKITKNWDDKSFTDVRPDSLTFTVDRIPESYQRVEYIEANGTQWIDIGVKADAAHTIYSDGYSHDANSNHLLQVYESNNSRLGTKLYGGSRNIQYHWCVDGAGQSSQTISYSDLGDIDVRKRLKMTQNASGLQIVQGDNKKTIEYDGVTSGTLNTTWKIFYYNDKDDQLPRGFLYEAKIMNGDALLHHYVPCYRKSDDEIGVYDLVDKEFLTNAGTGTFEKGNDLSNDVIVEDTNPQTITVSKDDWSINGDTWETTVTLDGIIGDLSIYEHDVENYTSDATIDSRKTIGDTNEVSITNTLTAEICDVKFDLAGGTLPGRDKVFVIRQLKNRYIIIPKETPTKKGYVFQYWEGSKYMPGDSYKVVDNHSFKAVWTTEKGKDGTPLGEGASAAAADKAITNMPNDKDPSGSKITPLKLKSIKQTKSSIKVTWSGVRGAAKYVVYGNECGKTKKMKKLTTVKGKSFNVKKLANGKKLKKGKYHKFIVVAIDSKDKVVSASKVIHVATKGGKNSNYKSVKVSNAKKFKQGLKKGKSLKIKAKATGKKVKKHVKLRYESSNPAVAKVSASGKVKAVKKGSAKIVVYAQNGVYKSIKIKVK